MANFNPLLLIIIGLLFSYQILYFLIPFLSKYVLDRPNKRSSHKKQTPTSGGISFVIISQSLYFINGSIIPFLCLPLAIIGFIDDKYNVSSKLRYFIQFLTGICILAQSNFFSSNFLIYENHYITIISLIAFAFVITAIINLVNFMDGLDGLVGGCMVLCFLNLSITNDINLFLIVGSLFGFLIWNWHPAKIFMGDVGSTFLAASVIGFILENNEYPRVFNGLIILFPIFADSISCLLFRFFSNQNIFKPHKLHLYQRLHQKGMSHGSVSFIYILLSLIIFLTLSFLNEICLFLVLLLQITFGLFLNKYFAAPFKNQIY